MSPSLRHGQLILCYSPARIGIGDVVVFNHQGLDKVKRVKALHKDGVYVLGDNKKNSTDSRQFGLVDISNIKAKVLIK